MSVISDPQSFNEEALFVDLEPLYARSLYLKIEGLNLAGSVKLKAATEMVARAERDGRLGPDSVLVESSSGNLGVALAMIAASREWDFLCVVDPRCNPSTRVLIEALGARVHEVTVPDPVEGFLGARLAHVRELCSSDERYVWLDQYANPGNWQAHYRTTGPEILGEFPGLDVLFVGAGTTGTLMGCARFLREHRPAARIVAVDAVGSVSFGGPPKTRLVPGLGMSIVPPQLDTSYVDDLVLVEEVDTLRECHRMATRGFLFGGSTGTVVNGALRWLAEHDEPLTAVALSPDLGGRYLDTVYSPQWVAQHYGPEALEEPAATSTDQAGASRRAA